MKRRTEEDRNKILKLKEIVIQKINLYKIKPNKISSNVDGITHPTIVNILNGKTEYPSFEKLKNVHQFIIDNYENITGEKELELTQNEKYDIIMERLEAQSVQLEIIFEILTSGRAKDLIKVLKKEKQLSS